MNCMTTLDCVEESIGRSIGSVGKVIGDPLLKHWKSDGKVLEFTR